MVATVGSIQALFQADMRAYQAGLLRGEKATGRFGKDVSNHIRNTQRRLMGLDRSAAMAGTAMKAAFAGVAAGAAGVLAPILSVAGALNGARKALAEFDRIGKAAKAGGLDAETYQELAHAAELGGVATDQFAAALQTFAASSGMAAEGKGRMVAALKTLHPELLKNIQGARTQEQRLRAVADALDRETDASRKAAIAKAAFGDVGGRMIEMLKGGSAALDDTARKARQLGLVVDRELIARAEELNDEFGTATKVIDLQFKQALINLAPIIVGIAERAARLAGDIRYLVDQMKSLDEQSSQTLRGTVPDVDRERLTIENQILELRQKQRETTGAMAQAEARLIGGQITALEERLAGLTEKGAKIEVILDSRRPALPPLPTSEPIEDIETGGGGRRAAGRNSAAEAAIREAEAVKAMIAQLVIERDELRLSETQKKVNNALRQAGSAATDEERAQIAALITEIERETEALQKSQEAAEFFRDAAADTFRDLVPQVETGNRALDSLIAKLMEAALQAALLGSGPLASLFGGGGGILKLFGMSFHSGGTVGAGGRVAQIPTGVPFAGKFHGGGDFGSKKGKHGELLALVQETETILTARNTDRAIGALDASVGRLKERPQQMEVVMRGVFVDDGGVVKGIAQGEARTAATAVAATVPRQVDQRMHGRQVRRTRPR